MTTATLTPEPSTDQVVAMIDAITHFAQADATLIATMDEDGTMLLSLREDGLTQYARFGRDGVMLGDWF